MEQSEVRPIPTSPRAWFAEIADAYLDAYEAIPFGVVFGDTITEGDLFHVGPEVCFKFRGIKPTKTRLKKATDSALSSYVATQDLMPDVLANPHIAFAFSYLASHFAMGLLPEATVEKTMNYIEEHKDELAREIKRRKKEIG